MFDPVEYINTPRWQTVSLGLQRTRELLEGLGDPQEHLRFVHVAGTNGKGSTCAFIASIMQQAGYCTGLFTSPALYCFEDRIRVNGVNIACDELCEVTERVRVVADSMDEHPTEFELLTAVAFCHFVRKRCDVVVVEVGLGGRLDSTNVIEKPAVSIITPISLDHCALLGNSLPEIAWEKAGIIKRGVPVVSAPQQPCVSQVIAQVAQDQGAPVKEVDRCMLSGTERCFSYRNRAGLSLGLSGAFQMVNAATALDAIDTLRMAGWKIPEEAIAQGLEQAVWPGRFEVVSADPLIIFDGGHNAAGMEALLSSLDASYPDHHRIVLSGVLEDKDYASMARSLVASADEIITITPPNPRALSADAYRDALWDAASGLGRRLPIVAAPDIASGVRMALERYEAQSGSCRAEPLICVCGSLYILGSVMEVLRQVGLAL